jgi:hypothetical protein
MLAAIRCCNLTALALRQVAVVVLHQCNSKSAVGSFAALPTAVDVAAHYADHAKHDAKPKTADERFH